MGRAGGTYFCSEATGKLWPTGTVAEAHEDSSTWCCWLSLTWTTGGTSSADSINPPHYIHQLEVQKLVQQEFRLFCHIGLEQTASPTLLLAQCAHELCNTSAAEGGRTWGRTHADSCLCSSFLLNFSLMSGIEFLLLTFVLRFVSDDIIGFNTVALLLKTFILKI